MCYDKMINAGVGFGQMPFDYMAARSVDKARGRTNRRYNRDADALSAEAMQRLTETTNQAGAEGEAANLADAMLERSQQFMDTQTPSDYLQSSVSGDAAGRAGARQVANAVTGVQSRARDLGRLVARGDVEQDKNLKMTQNKVEMGFDARDMQSLGELLGLQLQKDNMAGDKWKTMSKLLGIAGGMGGSLFDGEQQQAAGGGGWSLPPGMGRSPAAEAQAMNFGGSRSYTGGSATFGGGLDYGKPGSDPGTLFGSGGVFSLGF